MNYDSLITNIMWCIFIIFIFMMCLIPIIITIIIKELKKDWGKHRCSPFVMPFTSIVGQDPVHNFIDCVGSMQKSSMPKYTAPLEDTQTTLFKGVDMQTSTLKGFSGSLNKYRKNLGKSFSGNLNMFENVTKEFTNITLNMKTLIMNLLNTVKVLTHTIKGAVITGKSAADSDLIKSVKEVGTMEI
jgi:ABC-type glycerol-3-phosphate transport system permease component